MWAGIGVAVAARRWKISPGTAVATVAMPALPDLAQLLPLQGGALFEKDGVAVLSTYATASPRHRVTGGGPCAVAADRASTHRLHCVMHRAVIAAAITLLVWACTTSLWIPRLGWWSHIVINVFTHSADFYPVPVLYPITDKGFDGLAWITRWFVVANDAALAVTVAFLRLTRSRDHRA